LFELPQIEKINFGTSTWRKLVELETSCRKH
jgi:hypothetical protein